MATEPWISGRLTSLAGNRQPREGFGGFSMATAMILTTQNHSTSVGAGAKCQTPTLRVSDTELIPLEPLSQLALLELARRRPRNRVDELERIRQPEFGKLRRQKRTQIVRGCVRARLQDHGCQRPFRPLGVIDRDHRRLRDRGMTHQRALERDRTDPL